MAGEEPQRKRARNPKEPVVIQAKDPSRQPGELRRIGGSMSDDWNNRIANDTVNTLWLKNSDEETRHRQMMAALDGLIGIHPKDELEGMMAAQLIAPQGACRPSASVGCVLSETVSTDGKSDQSLRKRHARPPAACDAAGR